MTRALAVNSCSLDCKLPNRLANCMQKRHPGMDMKIYILFTRSTPNSSKTAAVFKTKMRAKLVPQLYV